MTETLRDIVIGVGIVCLTTSAITGRVRAGVRHKLATDLPGMRMSTRAEPSGILGPLAGRFARLTVDAEGLAPDRFALGQAEHCPAAPGHVRLSVVRSRGVPVAGVRARKAVLAIEGIITDALGLVGKGDLSIWRSGRGQAIVVVDAQAIERYAADRLTALSGVRVLLQDGTVVATGLVAGTASRESVVLRAKLQTTNDALQLAEPEVWLGGRRAPEAMARMMVMTAGPIMRLSDAGGVTSRFRLRDAIVSEGAVVLHLDMPPFAGTTGR